MATPATTLNAPRAATAVAGRYYLRFDLLTRVMHALLMFTFIGCALTGVPLTGGVRPEAITLVDDDPDAIRATVAHVELLGHETLVHADVGDVRLVVRAPGMVALSSGDRVHLRIDPARLHLFDAPAA